MEKVSNEGSFFGTASIGKILLRVAPPVIPVQLIRALYNIVDSFFVGKYSDDALTALSVVYPWQLIAIALAVGTGVGVNTYMARKFAYGAKVRSPRLESRLRRRVLGDVVYRAEIHPDCFPVRRNGGRRGGTRVVL